MQQVVFETKNEKKLKSRRFQDFKFQLKTYGKETMKRHIRLFKGPLFCKIVTEA